CRAGLVPGSDAGGCLWLHWHITRRSSRWHRRGVTLVYSAWLSAPSSPLAGHLVWTHTPLTHRSCFDVGAVHPSPFPPGNTPRAFRSDASTEEADFVLSIRTPTEACPCRWWWAVQAIASTMQACTRVYSLQAIVVGRIYRPPAGTEGLCAVG
ncbi:unnamed protein product, partial [Phaeothamnion confervicola]